LQLAGCCASLPVSKNHQGLNKAVFKVRI